VRASLLFLCGVLFAVRLSAATFEVTTSLDAGLGSLRQAIISANGTPDLDTIHFNLPGAGPHLIAPFTPLPIISNPVNINGASQPGFAGLPIVELNGALAGAAANGLWITAGQSSVRSLIVNGFQNTGILLETNGNNTIIGNFIGTDRSGTSAAGNGVGISLNKSSGNAIGLAAPGGRNVIAGNNGRGIRLQSSSFNVIEGNFIGVDVTGNRALGNGSDGIRLESNSGNNRIGGTSEGARNVIANSPGFGIILSLSIQNVIVGNYIGTDASGTVAMPNALCGITFSQAGMNTVGGLDPASLNLISGNGVHGVEISGAASTGNIVHGNFIGTDSSGRRPIANQAAGIFINAAPLNVVGSNVISGNAGSGVQIVFAASNSIVANLIGTAVDGTHPIGNTVGIELSHASFNKIGTGDPADRNTISGNRSQGIAITGLSEGNTVQGNFIGTDRSGAFALGNHGDGVLLRATNNQIGGTNAGAGNRIAFNQFGNGVRVTDATASGNTIVGNSIYRNQYLGINLAPTDNVEDPVTANDDLDVDSGPNRLQNFPSVTNLTYAGTMLIVGGFLRSTPSRSFGVDFYGNVAFEPTHGEGEQYLNRATITTDSSGFGEFSHSISGLVSNQFITATATDLLTGDTSEFSEGAGGLRITALAQAGEDTEVTFTTYARREHRLEYVTELSESPAWQTVPGANNVPGNGGKVVITDVGAWGTSRFYRVMLLP
jgi:hypothetical protein